MSQWQEGQDIEVENDERTQQVRHQQHAQPEHRIGGGVVTEPEILKLCAIIIENKNLYNNKNLESNFRDKTYFYTTTGYQGHPNLALPCRYNSVPLERNQISDP